MDVPCNDAGRLNFGYHIIALFLRWWSFAEKRPMQLTTMIDITAISQRARNMRSESECFSTFIGDHVHGV